jgi:hypothetical protein
MANSPQLVDNNSVLQPQLQVVRRLLPAASAAAVVIVDARRLNAAVRRLDELHHLRPSKVAPIVRDLDDCTLAG